MPSKILGFCKSFAGTSHNENGIARSLSTSAGDAPSTAPGWYRCSVYIWWYHLLFLFSFLFFFFLPFCFALAFKSNGSISRRSIGFYVFWYPWHGSASDFLPRFSPSGSKMSLLLTTPPKKVTSRAIEQLTGLCFMAWCPVFMYPKMLFLPHSSCPVYLLSTLFLVLSSRPTYLYLIRVLWVYPWRESSHTMGVLLICSRSCF